MPDSVNEPELIERSTFDRRAIELIKPHLDNLILQIPELRSVAIIFDYRPPLDTTLGVMKALIRTDAPNNGLMPDAVIGLQKVTCGFQSHLQHNSQKIIAALEAELLEAGNKVLQANQPA